MGENYNKFVKLLEEILQLNKTELDFGIYKILNYKRIEIIKFLEEDLLPQIESGLDEYVQKQKNILIKERKKLQESLEELEVDVEVNTKFLRLTEKIRNISNTQEIEEEIYSHLANFFKRYYKEGDFISLRRYKEDTYTIPYEGEEVKLYWANYDQYYIKTTEDFNNYVLNLDNNKCVKLTIVDASVENNNNKSKKGSERKFVLYDEEPILFDESGITIRFKYETNKSKQETLTKQLVNRSSKIIQESNVHQDYISLFEKAPTQSNKDRTVLEKYINDYISKNKFDYFIHKNLSNFLKRELDYYIKNEIFKIDDIDSQELEGLESNIIIVRLLKNIGNKIIEFFAQIENFQRKLWLKKKFIYGVNYCISINKIPNEFYEDIVKNKEQLKEWINLFSIEELIEKRDNLELVTQEFLLQNQNLILDTRFFNEEFKERLISKFNNLDDEINGVLVCSENFQALSLLSKKYKNAVDVMYIDPPYNTKNNDFIYKDNFKHSSWLSMMNDRLNLSKDLLSSNARTFISIDDNENYNLLHLEKQIFGEESHVGNITWEKRTKAQNTETSKKMLQSKTEYIHVLRNNDIKQEFNLENNGEKEYPYSDEKGEYRLQEVGQMSSIGIRGRETMIFPIKGILPNSGMQWKKGQDEINKFIEQNRLVIMENKPYILYRPNDEDSLKYKPFWSHFYNKDIYGTAEEGLREVSKNYGFGNKIETIKPTRLIEKLLFHSSAKDSVVLDFFAGSGTTADAVINLNRKDSGKRKYILVEMGNYFHSVTKPRILKAIYSNEWKNGKPTTVFEDSHLLKYFSLESYEDSLNNLNIVAKDEQLTLLNENKTIKEQYMINYMLDKETEDSISLLNIEKLKNPFDYRMDILFGTEMIVEKVDLIESFNYLLGLKVVKSHAKEYFDLLEDGEIEQKDNLGKYCFKVIEGIDCDNKILIIWRNITEDIIKDNFVLEKYLIKRNSSQEFNYNKIYINGDNSIPVLNFNNVDYNIFMIEDELKKKMFNFTNV